MDKKDAKEINTVIWVEGSIEKSNGEIINTDKFSDEFIDWIESKGMVFCGFTRYMTENEV